MDPITLKIILGMSVVVWLFICLIIYKSSRTAAWLAGSTVASCLFLLGATVAASFLVKRALFLAPLVASAIKNGSPPQLSKTFKKNTEAAARFSALSTALALKCVSAYFPKALA
jgi:hypothetical protein